MQDGRTAIVTGSARRVGRVIAEALVADGWRVLVHAREGARAREACEAIGAAGWVGADLMRVEAAEEIAAAAGEAFGTDAGLDLLVNSASSFEHLPRWEEADVASWQRSMAVNARAPYLLTVAMLPMLREARGLVVNVSDIAAHEHWPTFPIHCASKAALESLTLSGAAALRAEGVRMVALAPGTIMPPEHWSDARIEQERAAGKLGNPDALVEAIGELSADQARTGEIIPL
jgi:NAD(P)-dependent dehydrogenase (short-subunit alcohol dehydrogenase family)